MLIHGSSSTVENEDGFGIDTRYGDGSLYNVENELGEGRLEGSTLKEMLVIGLTGEEMNISSLAVVTIPKKEGKENDPLIVHPIDVIEE